MTNELNSFLDDYYHKIAKEKEGFNVIACVSDFINDFKRMDAYFGFYKQVEDESFLDNFSQNNGPDADQANRLRPFDRPNVVETNIEENGAGPSVIPFRDGCIFDEVNNRAF